MSYQIARPPESATALLFSDYLRSLWDALNPPAKRGAPRVRSREMAGLTDAEFFKVYHQRFESLLERPRAIKLALVSSEPGEENWVGGWLLGEPGEDSLRIHWVQVKGPFRRRGFATALVDEALRQAGDPAHIVATHSHPRWVDKMQQLGIRREPLGRIET